MGPGLTTVNYVSQIRGSLWLDEQGDHHPGVALEHLELLWEVRRMLRLQSLPLAVRSRQAFFIAATLLVMGVGHTIISSSFRASVYIGSGFQMHFCDKESPQGEFACAGKHRFELPFLIMACVCVLGSVVAFVLFIRSSEQRNFIGDLYTPDCCLL
ncbi:hypothetical protein ACQJBY_065828 [Aegilops geniculata]